MPELPDVEGYKRYLEATSLHQCIQSTSCLDERILKDISRQGLQRRLKGTFLERTRRWGKWLFVKLDIGGFVVLHFGMSGQLQYVSVKRDMSSHARFIFHFENNHHLAVISQRLLGQISFTDNVEAFLNKHGLGPDTLDVDIAAFRDRIQSKRGFIKSALMDQSVIAGIGNIYSDEILYQTGLHPSSKVQNLHNNQIKDLYKAMRRILKHAAHKGGDIQKFPERWLLARRGKDSNCPRCGGELKSMKVAGRTAWFCLHCQSKP